MSAEVTQEVVRLTGEQVDEITLVGKGFEYAKGSKREGKTYRRYRYEGRIFTVEEDSDFNKAFDEDRRISTTKLIKKTKKEEVSGEDGATEVKTTITLEFDSFTSYGQEKARALHNAQMGLIKSVSTSENVSKEVLDTIMSTPI